MNYFTYESAAKRYAESRPYFHPLVARHIQDFLKLDGPVGMVLDVGCGTGQSSIALTSIANQIVGTDLSLAMLAEAPITDHVCYTAAAAESFPFASQAFDLITSGLAFHWFERERFMAEAQRVLRPSGWLVIYNNWFTGGMAESPEFEKWSENVYTQRYPTPPRNYDPLTAGDAERHGFRLMPGHNYTNEVEFSVEELARYLTTQTNVIAAVEQGTESLEEVYSWLIEACVPFFPKPRCTFLFGGSIDYLHKVDAALG
jgi:SAM-dependent methyltransferase